MKIVVNRGAEEGGFEVVTNRAKVQMSLDCHRDYLEIILPTGERLYIEAGGSVNGFEVYYSGDDGTRTFNQGQTCFKNGFPDPPTKVDDGDPASPSAD